MAEQTIEEFLGLTEKEIEKRKTELRKKIPTIPGVEYLKIIDKQFEVQPWPFVTYLAYWNPDLLAEALDKYADYDGAGNYQVIMEQLKEHYIRWQVIQDIEKEQEQRGHFESVIRGYFE